MATSAFKSTTKRIPTEASTNHNRRSRSLAPDPTPRRSGKFVNTVRGSSDYPDINLDDLATEFFQNLSYDDEIDGSIPRRGSEVPESSRGRTRGRSVSVVRGSGTDSDSERAHSQSSCKYSNGKSLSNGNKETSSASEAIASNRRLGRSLSQKDFTRMHDGYSSHSSPQTEDEARDGQSAKNVTEKTIRAVYAQKKSDHPTGDDFNGGLYEVMKKELRHAVDEIKTELEQATARKTCVSRSSNCSHPDKSDVPRLAGTTRKHHATVSGKSDKRKDDLLAEFLLEEKRRRDPSSAEKPARTRKKSKDRTRISGRLAEEAEKYFEDFFSSFEDTDVSSFDGERSDTSSTFGPPRSKGTMFHFGKTEIFQSPTVPPDSHSVELEGVNLPWLQWETSNDRSPNPPKNDTYLPVTPISILSDVAEGMKMYLCELGSRNRKQMRCGTEQVRQLEFMTSLELGSAPDPCSRSTSSCGSWNPEVSSKSPKRNESITIDMDRYLQLQKDEELLLDTWRERHRISSGGLVLCSRSFM